MSDAKKCDRCGGYFTVNTKSRVLHEYFSSGIGWTKNGGDMCPRCAEKFAKWWNKKRKAVER